MSLSATDTAFLEELGRPRRRARPRIAPALVEAEHVMVDGVATWRLGAGPAVLLVHGWEDDNSLWSPLIDALAGIGRAVVAMDLPGHGFSEGERASIGAAMRAVTAVAAAHAPLEAVVAHSYGVPVSVLTMEAGGLAVDRAVLIAGARNQQVQLERVVERSGASPAALAEAQRRFEAENGRPPSWYDVRRAAPAMTAAALILHSLDDDACDPADAAAVADAWPGAELAMTDGLGHRLIAQDATVVARIVDFLTA